MEPQRDAQTVLITLDGVDYAVSPRLAAMFARLVAGHGELARLDRFQARFEVAGERVELFVTAPVRLEPPR